MQSSTAKTLVRGIMRKCPNCGRGALFDGYLRRKEQCAECGASFSRLDADDGPAWLTIGLTALIVVPLLIFLERSEALPYLLESSILGAVAIGCVLALLPLAKGFFLAALWLTRTRG